MFYKKYLPFFLIFFVSLIALTDLFKPGLPLTHDGQDHVARIANFYQNLSEGNIIPRWAENLNWGYGHPILMFLYPLPSYIASIFHFIGFSFIDSLKIVFGITFVFSGIAMYLWIRAFLGEAAGLVGGILYMFAPYRFVDLYVRGAIGEHVAFVFPPLVFYFLLKLSKKYSYWYMVGGSLSLAGLILAHNAITLMFIPLIFLYALYLLWQNTEKQQIILYYTLIVILGFGLSAFFWIPAFFEGKYTLRDIVTKGGYARSFVSFKDFFYGVWSYSGSGQFTVQVGIVQWFVTIAALPITALLWKRRDRLWILSFATLVIFFIAFFLMTSQSRTIWEVITILQKFQFPWRLLSITVFTTAVLGSIFIHSISKQKKPLVLVIIIACILFLNRDYWFANGYLSRDDSFFKKIYFGTTDTGESAPKWSVRFMEQPPKAKIEVIGGDAYIEELSRTSTKHAYNIKSNSSPAQIRENTLYFPGWVVMVDGKPADIEFQSEVNRGIMTFFIPQGIHKVIVSFQETKLRLLANFVSIVNLVILIFFAILKKKPVWQVFR